MANILVTGCAGFIGYHLCRRLLGSAGEEYRVIGLDNLNAYYDVRLKHSRLAELESDSRFRFVKYDIGDSGTVQDLFRIEKFDRVVNLAAQVGVRYSVENPQAYVNANLSGFASLLEACRNNPPKHLVFASSSSVYGANTHMPFSVRQNTDHPLSLYAATKKANELMAHAYAHLYGLPCTGVRFFTVYGPWGRPDMAYFSFTRSILESRPIQVYNYGRLRRDFTYVDDVVEALLHLINRIPTGDLKWSGENPDPGSSTAPYRIYNIGNNNPVEVLTLIRILESELGVKAILEYKPMHPGDVPETYADVNDLARDLGFRPQTSLEDGLGRFVSWYREYYHV